LVVNPELLQDALSTKYICSGIIRILFPGVANSLKSRMSERLRRSVPTSTQTYGYLDILGHAS
jgi:hypothetical protein